MILVYVQLNKSRTESKKVGNSYKQAMGKMHSSITEMLSKFDIQGF